MRFFLGLLLAAVLLVGCRGNNQGRQNLQSRVDSLRSASQELGRQVDVLRDSLQGQQEGITLSPPIYFPSGSAWIPDRGRRQLDKHAQTLKQKYPGADFQIQGYTDSVPIGPTLKDTYPSNWYLAAQRAAAVAHYLDTRHDVRSTSLKIEAFGPQPVGPNETPERRPKERRVEIVVEDGT
jgi:chemotaxis protein MotB